MTDDNRGKDYPKTGEYNGQTVDIAHALATFTPDELAQVVVDVPGTGKIRPWRFASPISEVRVGPDGGLLI